MPEPSIEEKIKICIEHLKLNVQYKEEKYGCFDLPQTLCRLSKSSTQYCDRQERLMQYTTMNPVIERLQSI